MAAKKPAKSWTEDFALWDAIAKRGTVLCPAGSACLSSGTFVHCAATAKRIVVPFHRLLASLVIIVAPRRWVQNGQNNSGVPRFASERTLRKIQALLLPIELHLQDSKTVFFFSKKTSCATVLIGCPVVRVLDLAISRSPVGISAAAGCRGVECNPAGA